MRSGSYRYGVDKKHAQPTTLPLARWLHKHLRRQRRVHARRPSARRPIPTCSLACKLAARLRLTEPVNRHMDAAGHGVRERAASRTGPAAAGAAASPSAPGVRALPPRIGEEHGEQTVGAARRERRFRMARRRSLGRRRPPRSCTLGEGRSPRGSQSPARTRADRLTCGEGSEQHQQPDHGEARLGGSAAV